MSALFTPADGKPRCLWCAASPDYIAYHDHEWGFPVDDDHRLFEKLSLEGFQSGLSWRTILTKRDNFRTAFAGFDFCKVATFTEADVERLLKDAGRSEEHTSELQSLMRISYAVFCLKKTTTTTQTHTT